MTRLLYPRITIVGIVGVRERLSKYRSTPGLGFFVKAVKRMATFIYSPVVCELLGRIPVG